MPTNSTNGSLELPSGQLAFAPPGWEERCLARGPRTQHLNYIGPRATILAFNRDPEAPIMTLNQRQPRPRVFPIVGDLFETVPALIAALKTAETGQAEAAAEAVKK